MNNGCLPSYEALGREKALKLLLEKEYGYPLPRPNTLEFQERKANENAFAGKAVHRTVEARVTWNGREFAFPFQFVCPKADQPVPAVVLINFTPAVPDPYLPSEELCDLGMAVASFGCADVSEDNGDFTAGAGGLFQIDRSQPGAPGKLAIWAWAASVLRDYLETRQEVDQKHTAVAGHSRMGKTALLAGVLDRRFQYVFANESGCSGAALYRGKVGETAKDIWERFPYWFCPRFADCTGDPETLDFDQHFLLSAIAPRKLYVGSAQEDLWSDPASELQGCLAASPAYEALGVPGLVLEDAQPQLGKGYHCGNIGYHLRSGSHFLSREDWGQFVQFLKAHRS
ncbi:MAG: hypothetical protein ACOYJZ_03635 [Acutalibacter sp.]|jgi:hypothetical protein